MIFIENFTVSRDRDDFLYLYENFHGTNIDEFLKGVSERHTTWSVPKNAVPGDTIIFMCAKQARANLGMATSHMDFSADSGLEKFITKQKNFYQQYSGKLLGYGVVNSYPMGDGSYWMSEISDVEGLAEPIDYREIKSFIKVSTFCASTKLDDEQWEHLKWVIHQHNPSKFDDAAAPDYELLRKEFDNRVEQEIHKPIEQLKKKAKNHSKSPISNITQTKIYHRDPVIAAYVKNRANGHCQLCGAVAPFLDQNGEPYLECHHIQWLSEGGLDSIDNCVALCPNCHRKMHIVNDPKDKQVLLTVAAKED